MKTKGAIVWDCKQGWTSPQLEVPEIGKLVIFIDYPEDDLSMPIVEPEVEELLSSLGYIGEGRYLGTNDRLQPLETRTVTYVETVRVEELSHYLQILQETIIPIEWFYSLDSEGNIDCIQKSIDRVFH